MRKKIKVGFITTLSGRWPRELPEKRLKEYGDFIDDYFENTEIIKFNKVASNKQEVFEAIELFKTNDVKLVIMLYGAFTGDDVSYALAEELNVPLILWAPYEPDFERNERLFANAMCSVVMNSAALKKIDKLSYVFYGSKEDLKVVSKMKNLLNAYATIFNIKGLTLGLLGYRPTAFYNSTFDETLIRKLFGIKIEETDLKVVFDRMEIIEESKINDDKNKIGKLFDTSNLPNNHLENHSRLYFALKEVLKEQEYDFATIKCWPEMGNLKTTPCAVMSRLADENIGIICEGDVDVALALILQNIITNKPSFITDMINMNEQLNTLTFWHCGNAPLSLFDEQDKITLNNHPLAGQGTAFYGSLKTGSVTVARFCNIKGKYKLFITKGEAIKTIRNTRGVMVNIKIDTNVREAFDFIINNGIAHHYSIVWDDILDEMKLVSNLLGIEILEI